MDRFAALKRVVATGVCTALVLMAPGVAPYRALAAVGVVPVVRVQVPVGGAPVGTVGSIGMNRGVGPLIPGGSGLGGGASLTGSLVPFGTIRPRIAGQAAPLALPVSAVQGLASSPAALRARAAALSHTSTKEAGSAAAVAAGITPAAADAAALKSLHAPALTQNGRLESGFPSDLSESLHPIRGRSNRLGKHFAALRAAFGLKQDAALSPQAVPGSKLGAVSAAASITESAGAMFSVPISAAKLGLKRLGLAPQVQGRAAAPSLSPSNPTKPELLTLRRSRSGLSIFIDFARRGAASLRRAALGAGSKRPSARASGLHQPEDAAGRVDPAPPASDEAVPVVGSAWFGLGKVAMMFIASLVVAQIGVEALGAAMPTLVQKTFGDFTVVAQLAIFSSIASILGRQLGPVAVRRFGLKKTYLGASVIRLVSISLLAGLLATGTMTLPLMMVFYSINGLLGGVSLTAMESIPPALVGQDPGRLEKFWTWEQTILEIIGISGPIATGAVVASLGFMPALVAFPVTMAASLAIVFLTLKIPQKFEALRKAELDRTTVESKGFWSKVVHGAKIVWGNKVLRYAFLGFSFYSMLNPFLYTMLGPAFGLRLVGAVNAELATGVIGWMTGAYSFGGLLGGFLMMGEQKRMKSRKEAMRREYEEKNGPVSDEAWDAHIAPWEAEALRKSLLRWMLVGTAGLVGIASFAFPLPMLSAAVTLPSWLGWLGGLTVQAAALIPFGVAQVVCMLKLRSFFQARVPGQQEMPDAMGFFGSASLAISTAGLLGLKALFQNFTGFTPFSYLALGLIPLGLYYLYLRWQIKKHSGS